MVSEAAPLQNLIRDWNVTFSNPSPAVQKAGVTAVHNSPKQVCACFMYAFVWRAT